MKQNLRASRRHGESSGQKQVQVDDHVAIVCRIRANGLDCTRSHSQLFPVDDSFARDCLAACFLAPLSPSTKVSLTVTLSRFYLSCESAVHALSPARVCGHWTATSHSAFELFFVARAEYMVP